MITVIDLAKLRNAEFLQFGTTISELIDANHPTELNLTVPQTTFKQKLTETSALFQLERANPFTQELVLLDDRRDKAMYGLVDCINGYSNHFDPETARAANLLKVNLSLYGTGVSRMNTQAETSTIYGIINDWESKPELSAALAKLGLTSWIADLKTANQLFEQKYIQRTQAYGAANPDTLKSKREETLVAYYELRKFIEANAVVHPSAVSEKMISELNALIDQYNELIRTRLAEPVTEQTAANPGE
jgi:hypothetical protein